MKRKLDDFITGCVGRALDERNLTRAASEEQSLVLDALIAEQFRLQEQVEALRRQIAESSAIPLNSQPPKEMSPAEVAALTESRKLL